MQANGTRCDTPAQTATPPGAVLDALAKLGPIAVQSGMLSREQLRDTMKELRKALAGATAAAPPKGLAVREVAVRLGICRKSVHRMIAAGALPSVRVTGSRKSLRVPESAVNAILQTAN
jgi:excisionase family DNA binding protein